MMILLVIDDINMFTLVQLKKIVGKWIFAECYFSELNRCYFCVKMLF